MTREQMLEALMELEDFLNRNTDNIDENLCEAGEAILQFVAAEKHLLRGRCAHVIANFPPWTNPDDTPAKLQQLADAIRHIWFT